MSSCSACGAALRDEDVQVWGERCGQCLAAEIELSLMGRLADARRKPAKRAIEFEQAAVEATPARQHNAARS